MQAVKRSFDRLTQPVAIAILSAVTINVAAAEGLFLELGAGYGKLSFEPKYYFMDGSQPETFEDDQDGFVGSLRLGYRKPITDRFSLDLGADFIYQDAKWTMTLPEEQAHFAYEIPYTFGLTLIPGWSPAPRWRLFAELGLEYGNIRERKRTPLTSHYDADEWVSGFLMGIGVGYQINDRIDLTLGYRQIRYSELRYKSYWPDGRHAETIEDSPRSDFTTLAVQYRF